MSVLITETDETALNFTSSPRGGLQRDGRLPVSESICSPSTIHLRNLRFWWRMMATLRCPVRDAVAYMLLPPPPPPPRPSRPAPSPPVRQRRWGRKNHNKMVLDDLDPMLEIDLTKQIFSYFSMDPPSRVHTATRILSCFDPSTYCWPLVSTWRMGEDGPPCSKWFGKGGCKPFITRLTPSLGDLGSPWLLTTYKSWDPPSTCKGTLKPPG